MGVDIQTYRARIGTYKHSRCGTTTENYRHFRGSVVAVLVTNIKFSNVIPTVGCVFFIGVLLMIAGVEPNPGPMEKGSDSYYGDEVSGVVKGVKKSVHGDTEEPKMIKISKLPDYINKEMLLMFFETKTVGDGKVVEVTVNTKYSYAIVEFDKSTAVYGVMDQLPFTIFGIEVDVNTFGFDSYYGDEVSGVVKGVKKSVDGDTEEPKMIKISKLPDYINKEMLLTFFERKTEGNGKVVNVTVNTKDSYAIVEFDKSTAVYRLMDQLPFTIFGIEVDVNTFGFDSNYGDEVPGVVKGVKKSVDGDTEKPKMIKISKLPDYINKEMLLMFFERKTEGNGKVVNVTVNTKDAYAIVEFDKSTAVYGVMDQLPFTIFGIEVDVNTFGFDSNYGDEVSGVVKGVKKSVDVDTEEPKMIKISKLPDYINKEMLLTFFEIKTEGNGKVVNVTVNTKDAYAIVEFDKSTAVYGVMDQLPLTIFGIKVDVNTCVSDTVLNVEPQDIPRIRISGLMENTNNEMLAMYFEYEERNGGGKVKNIEMGQKGKLATIDFEEKAGADAFMLRNPKSIMGMNVTVEVIEDKDDAEIEYDGRKMQGAESTQITGTTSNAETEPDPSHTNESKLKDAAMSDGWRVWKWKQKFWKLFGKPEAPEPSIHKYKNVLDKNGLTGLKDLLSKDLESWKSTMVHIAVTGQSGTGKSSFINSIRGLKPEDVGAAKVGVYESTFRCNRYEHPANKSFVVWDLPGVGTPNFPKDKYLKMVGIDRYNFFIIISKDRFTELDLWLAQKIREQKKTCFFVRSNIDVTIENNARDFSKTHNEKDLLEKIRENISKEFQKKEISDQKIFLISNCALNKYDFGNLNNELLSLSDGLQRETLALSLSAVTREVMEEKEKVLTGRIPKIALSIASASTKSEQKVLFKKEINFYRKQFNIDEETLSENREILFLTDDHLEDFRVVFDEHKQQNRMTMKTPTASMNDVPTLIRILDSFTWSKEKTLLYIFSEKALKINLELLYNMAKAFYDAAKFNNLVKKTST